MIVLDTHIWIWWVHGGEQLTQNQIRAIQANESDVIGVSAITCWEVAKLVEFSVRLTAGILNLTKKLPKQQSGA